jgi:hypothetical protein
VFGDHGQSVEIVLMDQLTGLKWLSAIILFRLILLVHRSSHSGRSSFRDGFEICGAVRLRLEVPACQD